MSKINRQKANDLMYSALDEIVAYAESKNVRIAIETEGSMSKKDHLLMQRPDEYNKFMRKYSSNDIGDLVAGTLPQHRVTKLSPRLADESDLKQLFLESMKCW